MAGIILPQPWASQPQILVPPLDRRHLVIATDADPQYGSVALGGATKVPTPYGMLLGGWDASTVVATLANHPKISPPFTVAFTARLGANSASYQTFVSQGGSGPGGGWGVGILGATNVFTFAFGGVANYNSTFVPTTNTWYRLGITVSGNGGTGKYFVNGLSVGSIAVGTMNAATSSTRIGAGWNGANVGLLGANSYVGNILIVPRAFTDAEMAQDYVNPWRVYTPQPRRLWVPTVTSGTFNPAWAVNSTQILGGGMYAA